MIFRSCGFRIALFAALALALIAPAAPAQSNWTGAASNAWTTAGNWSAGVPVSGNTAVFNGAGNGNTSISLGGAAQPIGTIQFDTAAAASYTFGALASGDAFNFDAAGAITVTNTVTAAQTFDAAILTNGR